MAGGSDRPSATEFRELSLAPWSYMQQVMELSRGVAGVVAVAAVLQTVWPFRAPAALGGEESKRRKEKARLRDRAVTAFLDAKHACCLLFFRVGQHSNASLNIKHLSDR